ncbi:hypothetical protein CONLIGDRAFT_160864 [Coniochaeta ligniaria NRRL 30616]|uniref:LIM zinc-binding domain-containing protein n=1 Tax=Coniochaeta ligniaria NRRL 30616 TaxID=1408157 RepID=A0A1J7JI14_9PEZI|nr:hypothetical protein CONLIGDRAFT_160864 [Coniochaeta ligniaria NRRL 30616]
MTAREVHPASSTPALSCPVFPQLGSLAFTCTFCWHIASTPPHVVGSSGRLACEFCYSALLDLSICWVCGEVVFRGEDCVSLGWCFWHKSCYGCLICGNRMVAHGMTVKEVFTDEVEHEDVGGRHGLEAVRGRAKEVDEIPLCAHCYVESGAEEMDSRNVVNRALRRMDYRDGGLNRKRYEDGRHIRLDGTRPESYSGLDNGICPVPLDSTIYVSIRDPTAPAFKPSPTKPIPRWMVTSPVQSNDISTNGRQPEPLPGEHSQQVSQAELSLKMRLSSYAPSSDRTAQPHSPKPEPVRPATPPSATPRPISPAIASPQPAPISPVNIPKIFRYSRAGIIDSESLKRPSSRLDRIREESGHLQSRTPSPYVTPPEWPDFLYDDERSSPASLPEIQSQAATVHEPGPRSIVPKTSSQSLSTLISPTQTPIPSRLSKRSTMLRAKIAALNPQSGLTAMPMSSEFLERYGLVKGKETPKPSALLKKTPPSSRRSSHEPQAILARLTKNSRSGPTTGPVNETTVVTGTDRSSTPKLFSFDSTTGSIALHDGPAFDGEQVGRRRSLQVELRRLFRGL